MRIILIILGFLSVFNACSRIDKNSEDSDNKNTKAINIIFNWDKVTRISESSATIQAIPDWMLIKPKPEKSTHEIGSMFRDPSGMELAKYFARIVGWYSKGGFRDELGKWQNSGHNYNIRYWEILNEPDHETIGLSKELYTNLYDVIVQEILKVEPEMKFMGMSMSNIKKAPKWTTYFLDKKNHKPGIPLDLVSYHLYTSLSPHEVDPAQFPYNIFTQADGLLETIRIVDSIRHELSPKTKIDINESGILFREPPAGWGRMNSDSIPDAFWNLSAAYYAYIYIHLTNMGIEIIGKSTLWSDPNDWPEVSVLNWKTGKPNARYYLLKLIRDNFSPGDKLIATDYGSDDGRNEVIAQGFITSGGDHKILMVNTTNRTVNLSIPSVEKGTAYFVDKTTAPGPPAQMEFEGSLFTLGGLGVAVLVLSN